MKGEATIVWVNDKPLEFDNGHKCYECKFCDPDGLIGKVYVMDKKPLTNQQVKIKLDVDGDNFKFKIDK